MFSKSRQLSFFTSVFLGARYLLTSARLFYGFASALPENERKKSSPPSVQIGELVKPIRSSKRGVSVCLSVCLSDLMPAWLDKPVGSETSYSKVVSTSIFPPLIEKSCLFFSFTSIVVHLVFVMSSMPIIGKRSYIFCHQCVYLADLMLWMNEWMNECQSLNEFRYYFS